MALILGLLSIRTLWKTLPTLLVYRDYNQQYFKLNKSAKLSDLSQQQKIKQKTINKPL